MAQGIGIYQLPEADTLSGTESIPIDTGADTKRATVAKVREGLLTEDGDGSAVSVTSTGAAAARPLASRFRMDPEDFGAVGDGVTDDHAALQAWIDWHKARGRDLILPAKTYRTTKSLDATMSGNDLTRSLTLRGRSRWGSVILGDLDEPYPILDIAGNYLASVEHLTVRGTSSGLATCALFIGKNSNGGACGHSCMVRHCNLEMPMVPYEGVAAAGLVIYSADLSGAEDCYITGPVGVVFGGREFFGVTSKFQSFTGFDSTKHEFSGNTVYGVEAAYWWTDGITATFRGGYASVVNAGPADAVKAVVLVGDGTLTGGSTNSVRSYDFRTENQSSAVGVHSFALLSGSTHPSIFSGSFDVDGALIYAPSGKTVQYAEISCFSAQTTGSATVFAGGAQVARCTVETNRTQIGDIASTSAGNIFGGPTLTTLLPEALAGGDIVRTTTGAILGPGVRGAAGNSAGTSYLTRLAQTWWREPFGFSAYAPSSEALVMTKTIPLSALLLTTVPGIYPAVRLDLLAVAAGAVAGTRLRLELVQGASTATIADITLANSPTYGDACNIGIEMLDNSGGGLAVFVAAFSFPGETLVHDHLYNLGWSLATDIIFKVYVTSSVSDPFYVARATGQMI